MKVITSKHFFFIKEDVLRLSSTQERTSTSYLVEMSCLFFKVVIFVLLMFFHSHFLFHFKAREVLLSEEAALEYC